MAYDEIFEVDSDIFEGVPKENAKAGDEAVLHPPNVMLDRKPIAPEIPGLKQEPQLQNNNWEAYEEASNRGLLPEEEKAAYLEAKQRGLVPGTPKVNLEIPAHIEDPKERKKIVDSLVFAKELGIKPSRAYEMHEQLTKGFEDAGLSLADDPLYNEFKSKTREQIDKDVDGHITAYAPYVVVRSIRGAMGPTLPVLKSLGMDTGFALDTAIEFWEEQLPNVKVPDIGLLWDETGKMSIGRIDDAHLSDIVGETAELGGFLAPMSVALKAGGLLASKVEQYTRPFYQKLLQGMIGGALLGEGKKDKTLEHMAMFGAFEGGGYAVSKIPKLVSKIKSLKVFEKADIKDRGKTIKALVEIIEKDPKVSQETLVKGVGNMLNEPIKPKAKPKAEGKLEQTERVDNQRLSQLRGEIVVKTDKHGSLEGGRLHFVGMLDEMNVPTLKEVKKWIGSHENKKLKYYLDDAIDDLIRVKSKAKLNLEGKEKVETKPEAEPKKDINVEEDLSNIDEELRDAFEIIRSESAASQSRGVTQANTTGQGETIGFSASSPKWMVDLQKRMKDIKEKLFTRKEIENLISKKEAGKDLTHKQSLRWQHLEDVANKLRSEDPGIVWGDTIKQFQKKGFTPVGGKKVVAGNLNVGDTVFADVKGRLDEYVVAGASKDGNVLLKNEKGVETVVDLFEEISIEAIRKKGVKAEPTRAYLNDRKKEQVLKEIKAAEKRNKPRRLSDSEKRALIKELLNYKVIPQARRLKLAQGLMGVKTAKSTQKVVKEIFDALDVGIRRKEIKDILKEKKFQKVENLRKSLKLPSLKKMSMEELNKYEKAFKPFEEGDVFLTQRQMETIDATDLKGIKTIREAREKFSERTGIPIDELGEVNVGAFDRMAYDTALAEKDPFYRLMVEDYHKAMLEADARFFEFEAMSNVFARNALESRPRTITEKLVPMNKEIFKYLSSSAEDIMLNPKIATNMTKADMEYAKFLESKFLDALEYLIKNKSLETGRQNYITNVHRDVFEAMKEGGFKAAVKEALNQQKLDEQTFNILDQVTGDILPLNKFFQFSLRRTGNIKPTQNVAKAASTYFRTFERKKALDAFIPKMMVYVDALSPKKTTGRGLPMDQRLKTFTKEWINTKKGRPSTLLLKPGSQADVTVRGAKAAVSIIDLGANIPVGVAANAGETVATYVSLGKKNMLKGIKRSRSDQGKKIVKNYKNFIGKSLWEELAEVSQSLGDKTNNLLFGFFKQSSVRSNKIFLLGSLTEKEFASGLISPKRLSELKVEAGKYRVLTDMKSIIGSTTEGGLATQYKSWAVSVLSTTGRNVGKLTKDVFSKSANKSLSPKDIRELKSAIEITSAALIVISLMPEDNRTFIGQFLRKVKSESLTILGAVDPTLWTAAPRMLQFSKELSDIAKDLVTLEKYSDQAPKKLRGKLKGIERAKKVMVPRAIKQFTGKDKKKKLAH